MIRSCSYPKAHWGAVLAGLAVLLAAAARPAWGQSSWPSYPNNSTITVTSGGNVGIGTASPTATLGIATPYSAGVTHATFSTPYANTGDYQQILFSYSQTDTAAQAGLRAVRYATADYGADLAFVTSAHAVGGPLTERMRIDANGAVGIGTTNPQHLLHVAGTIGAEEVLVTSTGADYVFAPGYRLKPLSEVAQYIEANHHLPDIPSAEEVKQKGMGVGEMEAKLLAKVEELTLHMIQQEKENQELRDRIAQLEKTTAAPPAPGAIPAIAK